MSNSRLPLADRKTLSRKTAHVGQAVLVHERETGMMFPAFVTAFGDRKIRVRAVDGSWHEYSRGMVFLYKREV